MVDAAEVKHRQRMADLLSACELQVGAGKVPAWIDRHFCKEHLDTITETTGLPAQIGIELVTIAVFLDKAFSLAPSRHKGPKAVSLELRALKSAQRNLFRRLSNLSPEAYSSLCQIEETTDEAGQPSYQLSDPPIQETVDILQSLGEWLGRAEAPTRRPGPRRSPKFYAILLLRNLLQEHKSEVAADELTYLAQEVVWHVAEYHGDDGSLGDFVEEVLAAPEVTQA